MFLKGKNSVWNYPETSDHFIGVCQCDSLHNVRGDNPKLLLFMSKGVFDARSEDKVNSEETYK